MKRRPANGKKKNCRRTIAAAGAVLSAAAVLITAVVERPLNVQAADTLIGIEKLRSRVQESGGEYVVLEVVPDRFASEIGYFFDGYEPILGEWDEETGEWHSWREVLCSFTDPQDRYDYIQGKKTALKNYYTAMGWADGANGEAVPMAYATEEYAEPAEGESTEGYERIVAGGLEKTGWFDKTAEGGDRFNLKFQYVFGSNHYDASRDAGTLHYVVNGTPQDVFSLLASGLDMSALAAAGSTEGGEGGTDPADLTIEMVTAAAIANAQTKSDNTPVYTKTSDENGDIYIYAGTWGEIKEEMISTFASTFEIPETTIGEPLMGVPILDEPSEEEIDDPDAEEEEEEEKEEEKDGSEESEGSGSSEESGGSGSTTPGTTPAEPLPAEPGTNPSPTEPSTNGSEGSGGSEETSGSGSTGSTSSGEPSPTEPSTNPSPTEPSTNPSPTEPNSSGSEGTGGSGSTGSTTPGEPSPTSPSPTEPNPSGSNGAGGTEPNTSGTSGTGSPATSSSPSSEPNTSGTSGTGSPATSSSPSSEPSTSGISGTGSPTTSSPSSSEPSTGEPSTISLSTTTASAAKARPLSVYSNRWYRLVEGDPANDPSGSGPTGDPSSDPSSDPGTGDPTGDPSGDSGGTGEPTGDPSGDSGGTGEPTGDPSGDSGGTGEPTGDPSGDSGGTGEPTGDPSGDSGGTGEPTGDPSGDSGGTGDPSSDPGTGDPADDPDNTGSTGDPADDPDNTGTTGDPADDPDSTGEPEDYGLNTMMFSEGDPLDEASGYYFVDFTKVTQDQYAAFVSGSSDAGQQLYVVEEIIPDTDGEYRFAEVDTTAGEPISETYQMYQLPTKEIYCKNTFTNNEWFKNYVLNMDAADYENFPVRIFTLTPAQVNEMISAGTLPAFDFLYLNSGLRTPPAESGGTGGPDTSGGTGGTGEPDTSGGSGGTGEPDTSGGSDGSDDTGEKVFTPYDASANDLSTEAVQYLYSAAVSGAKPCLVDGSVLYAQDTTVEGDEGEEIPSDAVLVNETLKNTNIFKLSALLCQNDLGEWFATHSDFMSISIDELLNGIVSDGDKNFVVENVYCRYGNGGDSIINSLFNTPTIYKEGGDIQDGFQSVLDVINMDNLYREADTSGNYAKLPTDISQATALRHILNYGDRRQVETKKNIRVLEIEPAKVDEPDITLEQIQKWAPGVESADITVMTTAEFIGKIEKLNDKYDLIYIGTSTDHLNMSYWGDTTGYHGKPDADHIPAGTAFNDADMDGLIYYNIGDLRAASMPLAGQLANEYSGAYENSTLYYYNYVRYGGNDITAEKEQALLSFLDGSYPVIVADDFFEQPVTVYDQAGYKGSRVNLPVGSFNYDDLTAQGAAGSKISSIKVKEGYQATFYNGWYFEYDPTNHRPRDKATITSSVTDLNEMGFGVGNWRTWDDLICSIQVEQISDTMPARTIDEDHIDNCTYLYDFVKQAMEKKYLNFYAWSDLTDHSEMFKFYLNRPKVSMVGTANGFEKSGSGSKVRYVEAGMGGRYQLEYHFTIHNEGAASYDSRYTCKLYIDVNADGKYSAQEEMNDITLTQGGNGVSADSLYADREYTLTREVPSGYKGLLPWRIEVTQADNPNIYTSMSGYTKLVGVDQEKIKIIQIGRDKLYDMNGATWAGGENEYLFDLGEEIEKEGSYYHTLVYGGTGPDGQTYEGISDEFDIDVTFMTISDYEEAYNADPECLSDYNMLILGFSDIYGNFTGTDTWGPMSAIVKFINSGKSVLFAHDTTSFFNYPQELNGGAFTNRQSNTDYQGNVETFWGYSLNRYIRDLVGMDRYGVRAADKTRYDKAYDPKSGRETPAGEVQGYTYTTINGKDYAPGGAEKKTYSAAELDTSKSPEWSFTNAYTNIRFDKVYYNDGGTTDSDGSYGEQQYQKNAQVDNMLVTQVNEGQIVEYPYDLPEQFEIAQTHGQYYQLDYTADDDGDGQSDLVVWYCLGARSNGDQTVYSQSPNDVRNNYYIYNKGNITYTGMGHSAHYAEGSRYTFNEAKLFINTMIASYQSGVKAPYITALKKGVPEADELKVMYRMYDSMEDTQSLDDLVAERTGTDTEKVYFTVQDVNFIKGSRQIAVHVYYQDDGGSGEITVKGEKIRVDEIPRNIHNASDGAAVDADNLTSGGVYYIEVPRSILAKSESGLDIYFEAQTTLTTNTTVENVYVTDKVYSKVQVLRAYMFNLE